MATMAIMTAGIAPDGQGLYDPRAEHDACGVGFVVHMKGRRSHEIVRKALQVLINLEHRGACGCEANTGDGAAIKSVIGRIVAEEGVLQDGAPNEPSNSSLVGDSARATQPIFEQVFI